MEGSIPDDEPNIKRRENDDEKSSVVVNVFNAVVDEEVSTIPHRGLGNKNKTYTAIRKGDKIHVQTIIANDTI